MALLRLKPTFLLRRSASLQALWRAGERDEARAKFRAAAGMDLSAADRARLKQIWAAANGRAI